MCWSEIHTYKLLFSKAKALCTCNLCHWELNNSVKKRPDSSRISELPSHNLWCHLRCLPPLQTSQSSSRWMQWHRNPARKPNPTSATKAAQHWRTWVFLNAGLAAVKRASVASFKSLQASMPSTDSMRGRPSRQAWPVAPASAAETAGEGQLWLHSHAG